MAMKKRIAEDMKTAMRDKDSVRLEAVRMLRAAIQRKEIDDQSKIEDAGVLTIIQKMVKQANDSIKQFQAGDRPDLVEKERASLNYIQAYLPAQLSDEEVDALIQESLQETAATSPSDMGKVMAILKSKLKGQADMGSVSQRVKASLAQ